MNPERESVGGVSHKPDLNSLPQSKNRLEKGWGGIR
jgi:hypothetical protein